METNKCFIKNCFVPITVRIPVTPNFKVTPSFKLIVVILLRNEAVATPQKAISLCRHRILFMKLEAIVTKGQFVRIEQSHQSAINLYWVFQGPWSTAHTRHHKVPLPVCLESDRVMSFAMFQHFSFYLWLAEAPKCFSTSISEILCTPSMLPEIMVLSSLVHIFPTLTVQTGAWRKDSVCTCNMPPSILLFDNFNIAEILYSENTAAKVPLDVHMMKWEVLYKRSAQRWLKQGLNHGVENWHRGINYDILFTKSLSQPRDYMWHPYQASMLDTGK